jgi:hypothetical protein
MATTLQHHHLRLPIIVLALAVTGAGAGAIATGCNLVNRRVEGNGREASQRRDVAGFTAVEVGGALEAHVVTGAAFSVVISGDENLLPLVRAEREGDTLVIGMEPDVRARPRVGLAVTVHLPVLEQVEAHGATRVSVAGLAGRAPALSAHGASRLEVTGVSADRLEVDVSGASNVTLAGGAHLLVADVSGASHVHGRELAVRDAEVDLSGAATLEINGEENVTGDASGASQVRVWGNPPRLAIDTSGASSVKRLP